MMTRVSAIAFKRVASSKQSAVPYPPMSHEPDITPGILLTHMRGMEQRLVQRIDKLEGRIDGMEQGIGNLTHRIDRLDINLTRQIGAIDRRLDTIEIESLPRRVAVLEGGS